MQKYNPTILVVTTTMLLFTGSLVYKAATREDDSSILQRAKFAQSLAPIMPYPKKDLKGRDVPRFDYLVVLTDCNTCSKLNESARVFMKEKEGNSFMILTPTMKKTEDLLQHTNYYVSRFTDESKFATIPAGIYAGR